LGEVIGIPYPLEQIALIANEQTAKR